MTDPESVTAVVYIAGALFALLAIAFRVLPDGRYGWERIRDRFVVVKASTVSSVKSPAVASSELSSSNVSSKELEAEKEAEEGAEQGSALVSLTENDLQKRLAAAAEAGRVEAFARLLGAGYLAEPVRQKQLTKMKTLVFETSRRIAAANAEIERIAAQQTPPATGDTIVEVREGKVVREDKDGRYTLVEGQRVEVA